MLNFFKKSKPVDNIPSNKRKAICPKCGGKIIESDIYWICSNKTSNNCNFKIPNTKDGHKLDIETLIDYQQTKGYQRLFNTINNEYNQQKKNRMEKLNFNDNQLEIFTKGTPISICPNCNPNHRTISSDPVYMAGRIYLIGDTLKCINTPHGCSFEMKASYGGVTFSVDELKSLMSKKTSKVYTFVDEITKKKKTGMVFLDLNTKAKPIPLTLPKYIFVKDVEDFINKYGLNSPYATFITTQINGEYYSVGHIYNTKISKNNKN